MKKKIAILGSTGSIGNTLLRIIKRNKNKFKIILLSTNTNYKKLLRQSDIFGVQNLIILDKNSYKKALKINKNKKIKFFNSFNDFEKIFKSKKIDYLMNAIIGIDGLSPTLKAIRYTHKIAIANKEAIVCGWNLIKKSLIKYNTKFIPVDSEHFSIWDSLKDTSPENISELYLTASGGPFLNKKIENLKNVSLSKALNHPNWKMGKKISIDSATMMNKVFEILEARNIFNVSLKKIFIITHPKSYVHAILKFKNGLVKIIAHDTTMEIPIFNSLYLNNAKMYNFRKLNLKLLNNLELNKIDKSRFKVVKILNDLTDKNSLYETVLISANDALVNMFLNKKIKFNEISDFLIKFIKNKEFKKYKHKSPKSVSEILELNSYVRLKILSNVYKYS